MDLSAETKEREMMGSCKKCGLCCKYVGMQIGWPISASDKNWMNYHGFLLSPFPDGKSAMAFAPCRCEHLTEDNLCRIYEYRPENCATLPGPGFEDFQPPGCRFFEEDGTPGDSPGQTK